MGLLPKSLPKQMWSLNLLETSGPVQACNGIASQEFTQKNVEPQPPGTVRACPSL